LTVGVEMQRAPDLPIGTGRTGSSAASPARHASGAAL